MGGGGGRPHYIHMQRITQNITIVVALMLAIAPFFMLGCSEGSSSSSSGGGETPVTQTLTSVSSVQINPSANDGTLALRWKAPSDATYVMVTATSTAPAQLIQVRVPAIEYRALFQQNRSYVLKGLHATTDYTVEIEARKDAEVSPKTTRSVTTLVDTTIPQDTLTQVGVTNTSNGIKITWDRALLLSGKTDIAEAIIQVIETTTGGMTEVSVQDITQGEVSIAVPTIDGISYDIAVIYKDSNGNKSTAKKVIRGIIPAMLSQTVAALPETNLTVTANDKNNSPADESLLIKWGSNFDFTTGKNLQVRIIETATNTLIAEEIVNNSSTATLSGATAQAKNYATVYVAKDGIALTKLYGTLTYKVEVYVSYNGKYSSAVSKELATTDKTTKSVTNISAVGGATSIVVSWQAPNVRDYAGVTITATEKESDTPAKTVTITERAVRNTQIPGLKATTEYTVAVQSQDYAGNKGTAANATVDTVADSTDPDPVTNIQASYPFVSATKVSTQIAWTEPTSNNKDIKEYSISIAEKDTSTIVVNEKKVAYPTNLLSVEELMQGKTYTITIQAIDYAGNKSNATTKDITTPQPLPPSEDLFQNKLALDKAGGAIQIKASFKTAPTEKYYILRMYDSTDLIAEKSITGIATTISFGMADGLEVPKTQANAKNYSFKFLTIENNIVSPVTTLADTVAVYDNISTAPPAPKNAKISIDSVYAVYEFSAGTITTDNKAPSGAKLTQAQIQYKVYIAEGNHSTKTLDEIKALAGVQTRDLVGDSTLKVTFIGKKDTTYTVGVEAINSLNPAYSIAGTSGTIKTVVFTAPPTAPNVTTYSTHNAVVFSVFTTGGNVRKNVITVQINASAIAGVIKADDTPLEATDLAYYVMYLKKEDTSQKPVNVSVLWAMEKINKKVAKYVTVTGIANQAIMHIPIIDSTSAGGAGSSPIETAKDYYIGVRVVNTTSPNYDASNSDKLFPAGFYTDVAEIKEVHTSKAVAPNQSLLAGRLVVSPSTSKAGTIQLVLIQLKDLFTGAKNYDGKAITNNTQLVYTVYGLQKDTTPTVAEVLTGRKVALGTASGGVYIFSALASLGLSSDTDPVIAIQGAKKYHFVAEVAIKEDPSKKVTSSSVASVLTASQATAPAEVRYIQTRVTQAGTGVSVSWTAPNLSSSHRASTGEILTRAQVSYKVYSVAKSGDTTRSVAQIKAVDKSPTTVAAGTTSTILTGLIPKTPYEIVVQAVNSTDPSKESTGLRYGHFEDTNTMSVQIRPAGNDGTLSLRWQAPSDATHVVVTATSTAPAQSIQVRVPAIEYRTLFQQDKAYTLKGLYATTDYTIEIEAQKSGSEVSPKTTRSVTTLIDTTKPKDTFNKVAVESATNGIKLTWDKALLSSGKTDIAEATIQVIEKTTGVKTEVSVQDVTQGEVTIAIPTIDGISYDVTVVYKDSNGNESTAKQALRGIVPSALSQTVAALPEANLTVTANDKSNSPADESLLIKWGNVTFTNKNLQVRVTATATNTLIAYETVSNSSTATLSSASADNQEYATVYVAKDGIALTKLYGTLTYKVEVYVSQNGKYSTAVSKELATTDKSTEPVSNVSAVGGATSIVVSWQAPNVRDYAGVSIEVTEKNSPAKTVTITDRTLRNTQIPGLKATTEYSIAVQSQDYTGNKGAKITATTTTVDDSTAPDAVTNIQASYPFVSPTKIGTQITWTAPDITKAKNKDIKEYSISIQEKGVSTAVLNEKKIPYPTTSLSVEVLSQGKTYTVTIQAIDYSGNKSTSTTQDIITPQPTAPSEELFQNKPSLDTTGVIQIKATFKTAPGIGRYYTLRMYDGATLVAEKSITESVTAITFGIADGLEVPKSQANAKNYSFTFLTVEHNRVSPPTTLTDKVAVYDAISTVPPAPENLTLLIAESTATSDTVQYEFQAGTITSNHKAPSGSKLTQAQIQYKVYIVAGDQSTKTIAEIKAMTGVQTQNIAGISSLRGTFIGTKGAVYTIGIEAINSLNPSTTKKAQSKDPALIQKLELSTIPTSKATAPTSSLTGKLVVSQSTNTTGTIKLVLTQLSTFTGAKNKDGTTVTSNDELVYTVYGLQKDTTPTVAEVQKGRKVTIGSARNGVYTVPALSSIGLTSPTVAIKGATKYHFVVEVAIKTDPSRKAVSTVASVTTASQATAPAEVSTIQTRVAQTGMRVSWTAPNLTSSHKANTGDTLTTAQVSYKVYKVAKSGSAQRTIAEIIIAAGGSPTTTAAGTTNTTLIGLTNGTTYEIVVQAINSTDDTKTSAGERHEFVARGIAIGNTSIVSAEVGKTPAINITRVLSSTPSGNAFTCDATILEKDAKKIKDETGLAVSFNQNSKTVTITGIANKSNVRDPAITEYSYDVVQCTITASNTKVPATIVIQTGLRTAPSGQSVSYYRPTTKAALQAIITAEKTRQGSGGNGNPSPNLNMIDTSAITDMSNLFDRDRTFNGDITQWNTSNVEDINAMFFEANAFNQDIGGWNTGKVTSMEHVFRKATIFNQDIGGWNTGKVTSMHRMFSSAIAFNQDIGNWNVEKVTDISYIFYKASAFNQDIGNWDVSKVTSISIIFYNAYRFDQDLSSWKLCNISRIGPNDFSGSAMAGKTAQYPKIAGSPACTS